MAARSLIPRLTDIIEAIERIHSVLGDMPLDVFETDWQRQWLIEDHRKFVLRQPCLVCGRVPSDPHHLTFTQRRALGRRVSDEFIVPVCRVHHSELHRSGDEFAWWPKLNIDPLPVALTLWQRTRADGELAPTIEALAVKTVDVKPAAQGAASDGANRAPA